MKRIQRHRAFLTSILREGNRNIREDMLQHANSDQINAVSEFVLNLLKNRVPLSPPIMAKLKRHKQVLRELAKRRNSIKKRKQHLLNQKGAGFWRGLNEAFCSCLR